MLKKFNIVFFIISFVFIAVQPLYAEDITSSTSAGGLQKRPVRIINAPLGRPSLFMGSEGSGRMMYMQGGSGLSTTHREDLNERFLQRKEELASKAAQLREQFQQKKEQFQTKLQAIKDKTKQAIVQRVDQRLETINKNRVDHFNNILDRLTAILNELQQKVDEAKTSGKDTSSVQSLIDTAKTSLDSAQTLVSTQSSKDYTPTITTDSALRQTVGTAASSLQSDLQIVYKAVIAARKAVFDAVVAFRKLQIVDISQHESSPAATTNSQ